MKSVEQTHVCLRCVHCLREAERNAFQRVCRVALFSDSYFKRSFNFDSSYLHPSAKQCRSISYTGKKIAGVTI